MGGPGVAGGCRVGLVVALALARAALLPVSRATVAPQPTAYPALGDSLAVGTEARQPEWLGYVPRLSRTVRRPADAERLNNCARAGETSAAFRTGGHLAQAVAAISDPTTDVRRSRWTSAGTTSWRCSRGRARGAAAPAPGGGAGDRRTPDSSASTPSVTGPPPLPVIGRRPQPLRARPGGALHRLPTLAGGGRPLPRLEATAESGAADEVAAAEAALTPEAVDRWLDLEDRLREHRDVLHHPLRSLPEDARLLAAYADPVPDGRGGLTVPPAANSERWPPCRLADRG